MFDLHQAHSGSAQQPQSEPLGSGPGWTRRNPACLASRVCSAQTLTSAQDLCGDLVSNPHSQPAGGAEDPDGLGSAAAAEARAATLALCNAPPGEYVCVFTSGATGMPRGGRIPQCLILVVLSA